MRSANLYRRNSIKPSGDISPFQRAVASIFLYFLLAYLVYLVTRLAPLEAYETVVSSFFLVWLPIFSAVMLMWDIIKIGKGYFFYVLSATVHLIALLVLINFQEELHTWLIELSSYSS